MAVRTSVGIAEVWVSSRIAWQIERHFSRYGEFRVADNGQDRIFTTPYANARQLIAWVLGLGENARLIGPTDLAEELRARIQTLAERHSGDAEELIGDADMTAWTRPDPADVADLEGDEDGETLGADGAIRPERFARLVTLASILIDSGRRATPLNAEELKERLGA